jgi:dihydropteroate synthase
VSASPTAAAAPAGWQIGPDCWIALDQPRLIGILNVTPDSFSDGGRWATGAEAVEHALKLAADGAAVIDVGGESTRPGAARVSPQEQIARTCPVIESLRASSDVIISIDTTRTEVARAALATGARIINDVSAGTEDPAMLALAAEHGCGLVLMHRARPPEEESYSDRYASEPAYDDVTTAVRRFLGARLGAALQAGVPRAAVVLDPGLGFGKSVEQNYQLIRQMPRLLELGCPLLSAASRKSFVGAMIGEADPSRRDVASAAISVAHWLAGVRLFRVHDVALHSQVLRVAAAISPP